MCSPDKRNPFYLDLSVHQNKCARSKLGLNTFIVETRVVIAANTVVL